jgi:serine/threonine protein kinase
VSETKDFPRRFSSYVLLKPLARGGMGELYLALSGAPGMEKLCVIKKVLPHLVAPDNVQRFRDEAMVAVRLSHSNLVTVFDAGHSDDQIYLAMDFIEGKDLLATWNRCAQRGVPFPIEVAAYIVKELARGLGYAHAFGGLNLVHRDVSPANVLLSYAGEVKLTDFGLATSTLKLQHTAPGIIFGKLSYLAPEQARREPLDGRTDIYVCGILLWELLTGQQLFPVKPATYTAGPQKSDSTADALERVRNPRAIPPSQVTDRVPVELDRIVMRALEPMPADRYQTGEELRADLGAFLARTAPETDADRLARFLRLLFEKDTDNERREREEMVRGASHFLSGAVVSRSMAYTVPHSPGSRGTPTPGTMRADAVSRRPAVQSPGDAHGGAHDAAHGGPPVAIEGTDDPMPSVPDRDPRVGTTVAERYFLRRLCGEGAMGRVYEGQHIDIGRRVAIKILQSSFRHTPEVVERFRREARSASRIGHPNIVDVTDSGTTEDGAFFFVMEYLDGINLEDLINREGMLSIERAILIGAQICRALQAAHTADVIHRDLKPANIMLINGKEDEDFVKVLDFGISKTLELDDGRPKRPGLTNPDVAVGTPVYMSPEQAAGMPADARTDVYAVGGLLYEMLTAVPPCDGDNILAILNKKASEDPRPARELRPGIPAQLEAIVMRAMSRFAEDRQQSMATLKEELVQCLAVLKGAPTPAAVTRAASGADGSPQQTLRIRSVIRSHPWVLGVGTAALVVGTGVWWTGHSLVEEDSTPMAHAPHAAPPVAGGGATPTGNPRWPETARPVFPEPATSTAGGGAPIVEALPPAAPVPAPLNHLSGAPTTPPRRAMRPSGGAQKPMAASGRASELPRRLASAGALAPTSSTTTTTTTITTTGGTGLARAGSDAPAVTTVGPSLVEQAQAAFNKGNYAEAARRARQAVAAGSSALAAHLLLGDVYYHMERYAEALREYQAALKLDPENPLANRGRSLAAKQVETAASE